MNVFLRTWKNKRMKDKKVMQTFNEQINFMQQLTHFWTTDKMRNSDINQYPDINNMQSAYVTQPVSTIFASCMT